MITLGDPLDSYSGDSILLVAARCALTKLFDKAGLETLWVADESGVDMTVSNGASILRPFRLSVYEALEEQGGHMTLAGTAVGISIGGAPPVEILFDRDYGDFNEADKNYAQRIQKFARHVANHFNAELAP